MHFKCSIAPGFHSIKLLLQFRSKISLFEIGSKNVTDNMKTSILTNVLIQTYITNQPQVILMMQKSFHSNQLPVSEIRNKNHNKEEEFNKSFFKIVGPSVSRSDLQNTSVSQGQRRVESSSMTIFTWAQLQKLITCLLYLGIEKMNLFCSRILLCD